MAVAVDRVQSVFAAAAGLNDPAARAALLDRECGPDAELRRRVELLLKAHDDSGGLPAAGPPGPLGATGTYAPREAPGEAAGVIVGGRYKLLERIGEGGMGTVWMADQTEPVKRRVAVKLIRPEREGAGSILARFEAERQAIAVMDHPNIAKLLDAGETEGGRPFFVMEFVKGEPLTAFCDGRRMSVRERLDLFVQVCQAVQHAHQKGVIHRDLKPSNILVELHDGRPTPKVIDFGLAKATGGRPLTDRTLFTAFGTVAGTPLYMAPEQARLDAVDVDTRADVYALGVILYELLTGSTPIERAALKQAALDELLRLIRESEPPAPSKRLSSSENVPSVAASRHSEPAALAKLVRGELDWIVMKALEKDRDRRYETANGFAADVRRYLADEPVQACPPSAAYRFRKFVRRNKGQVVAASLVLASLLAGVVGTSVGMVRAEHRRVEADKAREQAQKRLAQIERGNEILGSIFEDVNINEVRAGAEPLEAVLAKRLVHAAGQLEGEAVGDPLVVASLQDRLGHSLLSLGYPQDAIPLFLKARETRSAELGADHPDTLISMAGLGSAYRGVGKLNLALPLFTEVVQLRKAKFGADHPATLASMSSLGQGYLGAGKLDLALPLFERTLELTKSQLGADHPQTHAGMNNLAMAYYFTGKLDLALPLLEGALKLEKAQRGADHPGTLKTMNNLAAAYLAAGKLSLALPLMEEVLKLTKAKLGADHPDTLARMANLGEGYRKAGKIDLALPLFEEALKLTKAKFGADHPDVITCTNNLAAGYHTAGKVDRELPLLQEAAAGVEKRRFEHEHAGRIVRNLIGCYEQRLKRFDEAEAWRRKWLPVVKERTGADSAPYADQLEALGLNLQYQRKWADSESVLRECLAIRERKDPDGWETFHTQSLLAGALLGLKKYAEAEPLLLKGYEGLKRREKSIPPGDRKRFAEALDRLITLYVLTNKPAEAAKWRAEQAKTPASPPPHRGSEAKKK